MRKWKVTPEKESPDRRGRIGGVSSFSGELSEESKRGQEDDAAEMRRSKSLSLPASIPPVFSIGSSWTEVIQLLRSSGSVFEAVNYLRSIEVILQEIPPQDRLAYCKEDFLAAVNLLKSNKALCTNNFIKEVIRLTKQYFNEDRINRLPEVILQKIFTYHQPHKFIDILTTCQEWHRIGLSKPVWMDFYIQRFIPPSLVQAVAKAARESDDSSEDSAVLRPVLHVTILDLKRSENCVKLYRSRILVPMVQDMVEVMWKGKFRLDDNTIYSGLGWWTAQVLGHRDKCFKIRYPGWSERWEEWIPRSKIRLSVGGDIDTVIKLGDVVEVWCTGAYVPGVWLLCQVKKIKRGKYGFDNVSAAGMLWVDRDRIRPAEFSSFTRNHVKFIRASTEPPRRFGLPPSVRDSCTVS